MKNKVKSIHISGKIWFQKLYGNSYHTAEIYVDGKFVHKIPFSYGYGSMYEQNAVEWLVKNGYLPLKKQRYGGYESAWAYCRENGIAYVATSTKVGRKSDL